MKKLFIPLILSAAFTFGCTEQSTENQEHVHEDGTTHDDHAPDAPVVQEEFEVEQDATATDSVHTHEDGETHAH